MQDFQNIIFDLGGVLLNIDYRRTENAFAALGINDFHRLYHQFFANDLFSALETGRVNEKNFYDLLNEEAGTRLSMEQIIEAWNAMLLDWRSESLALLPRLSQRYRLFLLSNTNEIHHAAFQLSYRQQYGAEFDTLFEAAHYSHLIGLRKPHPEAFLFVLRQHGLEASATLFIDDSQPNIEAAAALGLQTLHLKPGMRIEDYLTKSS